MAAWQDHAQIGPNVRSKVNLYGRIWFKAWSARRIEIITVIYLALDKRSLCSKGSIIITFVPLPNLELISMRPPWA